MCIMLASRTVYQALDSGVFKRVKHFIIEFALCYVSQMTRIKFGQAFLLGYMRSVQRRVEELRACLNLFQETIFNERLPDKKTMICDQFLVGPFRLRIT